MVDGLPPAANIKARVIGWLVGPYNSHKKNCIVRVDACSQLKKCALAYASTFIVHLFHVLTFCLMLLTLTDPTCVL